MSKLILTFVLVLSATSVSLATCPFSNMASNSAVGRNNTDTNYYNLMAHHQPAAPVDHVQPVDHSK